jgi:hypothetical protein
MPSRKILAFILLFVFYSSVLTQNVFAHSPSNINTIFLEDDKGEWTIQIRAAFAAFEQQVHQAYSSDSYSSPQEFNELLLGLLEKNFTVIVNGGEKIEFTNQKVNLGHETIVEVKFSYPKEIKTLSIESLGFQKIYRSRNTIHIVRNGRAKALYLLNKDNNFKIDLKWKGDQFVEYSSSGD